MAEPRKLTNKQRAFIEHYLRCWNASEAARLAGYSEKSAGAVGHQVLKSTEVSEEIKDRLADLQASADEVIVRLTDHARGDMADFLHINKDGEPRLDIGIAEQRKRLHLIKKAKTTRRVLEDGGQEVTLEVELYDAQSALVQLGRVHKLFTDKTETVDDARVAELKKKLAELKKQREELERASDT